MRSIRNCIHVAKIPAPVADCSVTGGCVVKEGRRFVDADTGGTKCREKAWIYIGGGQGTVATGIIPVDHQFDKIPSRICKSMGGRCAVRRFSITKIPEVRSNEWVGR